MSASGMVHAERSNESELRAKVKELEAQLTETKRWVGYVPFHAREANDPEAWLKQRDDFVRGLQEHGDAETKRADAAEARVKELERDVTAARERAVVAEQCADISDADLASLKSQLAEAKEEISSLRASVALKDEVLGLAGENHHKQHREHAAALAASEAKVKRLEHDLSNAIHLAEGDRSAHEVRIKAFQSQALDLVADRDSALAQAAELRAALVAISLRDHHSHTHCGCGECGPCLARKVLASTTLSSGWVSPSEHEAVKRDLAEADAAYAEDAQRSSDRIGELTKTLLLNMVSLMTDRHWVDAAQRCLDKLNAALNPTPGTAGEK